MANKIKLGNRPKTFKPVTLTVQLPEGGEGQLPVVFKYFTKTESGELFDQLIAAAKEKDGSIDDSAEFSLEAVMGKTRDQNAAYMLRVIDSWGLDEELTFEALQQLDNEMPAAAIAVMSAFREAAQQGRLGN